MLLNELKGKPEEENETLHDYYPDPLSDDVTCQLQQQVRCDVVRVGVQRSDVVMLSCSYSRTPASVADHITLPIDSHQRLAAGYFQPARHQFSSPRRSGSNEAFVVVTHQPAEVVIVDLHVTITCMHQDQKKLLMSCSNTVNRASYF